MLAPLDAAAVEAVDTYELFLLIMVGVATATNLLKNGVFKRSAFNCKLFSY